MKQKLTSRSIDQIKESKIDTRIYGNPVFDRGERMKYSINGIKKSGCPFRKNKIRTLPHNFLKCKFQMG